MTEIGPTDPAEARRRIVAEWVRIAESDMGFATKTLEQGHTHYAAIAFHPQQAVEKLMKAVLIDHRVRPPRTHDLERLAVLLESVSVRLSIAPGELERLTKAAVEQRYPDVGVDITEDIAKEAHRIATAVWVQLRPHL